MILFKTQTSANAHPLPLGESVLEIISADPELGTVTISEGDSYEVGKRIAKACLNVRFPATIKFVKTKDENSKYPAYEVELLEQAPEPKKGKKEQDPNN